jgi:acyl dehydratase
VLEQTPSQKDATRGTVQFRWDVLNQDDEVVCSMTGRQHYRRRAPATLHDGPPADAQPR